MDPITSLMEGSMGQEDLRGTIQEIPNISGAVMKNSMLVNKFQRRHEYIKKNQ